MDSYPSEFVSHHVPLLFCAGLGAPTPPSPLPLPPASPADSSAGTTASPPASAANAPTDPFAVLLGSLRKAMASRKSWHIWDNSRGVNNDFHVVLVDKNVRFPPLKARPSSSSQQPPPALHSPISPLSQSSPLYPDGIMAPIWIRKHREMVPAVFVLVLRLGEHHSSTTAPLDSSNKGEGERHQDGDLVREILERKRSTLERGIKLAVVLLCSRRLLDDPTLDSRLSLIRRQSGLDSRASLFVISPVPQSEVNNFVLSLRAELYPAALDYYREHGRRVRRKRARQVPKGGLSDKGWNVRYDYKMGLFSEMRGEMEVALKHYEDCYETLVEMFSHISLLTPRTKRWAEAKVLADCLTVKVSKMYLYLNEPSRAVAQLNRHVSRFRELSNTWGIGEQTFEFWSWLSKQYRLFGDLVAIGLRAGFRLPSVRPPPTPKALPPGASQAPSPSLVPTNVLQHPGYYFYLAATCAVERRERFRTLAKAEASVGGDGAAPPPVSPAVAHETKVDHAEIIIELYTKAYEFFKAHKTKNMTFFVASQIALAHYEGGNHEMALKFHDRIAKNYRRDKWRDVLDSILQLSCDSAVRIGDHESAIRSLVELLAPDSRISVDKRAEYGENLQEILKNKSPSSPEKGLISISMSEIAPLFDCRLVFWQEATDIGQPVPFQLSLTAPPTSRSSELVFNRLEVQFNDDRPPIVVSHVDSSVVSSSVEHFQLGNVGDATQQGGQHVASLCWADGTTKVFAGTVAASRELTLTISSVTLTAIVGEWTLSLAHKPEPAPPPSIGFVWRVESKIVPLLHADPSTCSVRPRKLNMDVTVLRDAPAYLGEAFAIHVDVVNQDDLEVEVFLDILLQPGDDDSPNQLVVDDQISSSFIKAVSLGVLSPSSSLRKTFQLECAGTPGDRQLDLSIRSQLLSSPTSSDEQPISNTTSSSITLPSSTEILRTLTIPAVHPLHCAFDTQFHRRRRPVKALLDLSEPDGWEGSSDVTLVATLHAAGPWDIEVTSLRLACENAPGVRVTQSSLAGLDAPLSLHWQPRDLFNSIFRLDVAPSLSDKDSSITGAHFEILWRRHGDASPPTLTSIPLLPLQPLPLNPAITLRLPPFLTLHQPFTLTYHFANPTPHLLSLSTQVDSADPGTFVFAGPRKFPVLLLAPDEERDISLVVIPLVVGPCALPRMRVFQHEREVGDQVDDRDPSAATESKMKELIVVGEADVHEIRDPVQVGLEEDLRMARGGREDEEGENGEVRPFVVMVLPR